MPHIHRAILSLTSQSASRQQLGRRAVFIRGPRAAFPQKTSRRLNDALVFAKPHVKIICLCCWIFLATLSNHLCAGCSACKVSLFAISFLCHVSALKSPVSFSPPLPALPLALFSSECFSKPSLARARISRTAKTEGREPNSSGGNGSGGRRRRHAEAKQT